MANKDLETPAAFGLLSHLPHGDLVLVDRNALVQNVAMAVLCGGAVAEHLELLGHAYVAIRWPSGRYTIFCDSKLPGKPKGKPKKR